MLIVIYKNNSHNFIKYFVLSSNLSSLALTSTVKNGHRFLVISFKNGQMATMVFLVNLRSSEKLLSKRHLHFFTANFFPSIFTFVLVEVVTERIILRFSWLSLTGTQNIHRNIAFAYFNVLPIVYFNHLRCNTSSCLNKKDYLTYEPLKTSMNNWVALLAFFRQLSFKS